MLTPLQHKILITLALIALLLAATNAVLFSGNRSLQSEIASRGQYIQQSLQLEPLYQGLIRTLAELAAKDNDPQLRGLLSEQGISFTITTPPAASED